MTKKANNQKIIRILFSIILTLILPCIVSSQKLNIFMIELKQKHEYLIGEDTIKTMNNALFHKYLIELYGKDKYYDILKNSHKMNSSIAFLSYVYNGEFKNFSAPPKSLDNINQIIADPDFVAKMKDIIQRKIIFTRYYNYYHSTKDTSNIHDFLVFGLHYPYNDIDSLNKEKFLKIQIHRLDSILTQTEVDYYRSIRGQKYNSKETPIFNDSILFDGSNL